MKKIKVLSILGTRPEAIKMAPVVQELSRDARFDAKVCVTAQHREMLDQVMGLFDIQADLDLDLMQPNQNLAALTSNIFTHLDPILVDIRPNWILIQGDTTTVMCAALNAFYHQIKIGHIEAGLRTHDKWQPFPEEINRRVVSVVADLHFTPTQHSRQNLLNEGVADAQIKVTGNTVIDALNQIIQHPIPAEIKKFLAKLQVLDGKKELIVVTAHRRENFGQPIQDICHGLIKIANEYQNRIEIIYPVHLNPNIQEPVHQLLADVENITLLDPIEYLPLVHLLKNAKLVLTDSGGIQEEATGLGVPTLVLREVTERPEGVDAGVLKIIGTDSNTIFIETQHLLNDQNAYQAMAHAANPFGDGHAAQLIIQALLDHERSRP